jgi:hypothetical protein
MRGFEERKDAKGKEGERDAGAERGVEEAFDDEHAHGEGVEQLLALVDQLAEGGRRVLTEDEYRLVSARYEELKDVEKLVARSTLIQHGQPALDEALRGAGYGRYAARAVEAQRVETQSVSLSPVPAAPSEPMVRTEAKPAHKGAAQGEAQREEKASRPRAAAVETEVSRDVARVQADRQSTEQKAGV